jgi:hypothetical protein
MMLSLETLARCLGGRVRGDHVTVPGPEAVGKRGCKTRRHTVTIYLAHDGDIRVNCHHSSHDPIDVKDWVRQTCGLPVWKPTRRGVKSEPSQKVRNQFFQESLRIARNRSQIDFPQFCLLINDLKNARTSEVLRAGARALADEFEFSDRLQEALRPLWRKYEADERAAIWRIQQEERLALGLRRTGCVDRDKAGRERDRRDRYNAKRRAKRAALGAGVNKMPSSEVADTLPKEGVGHTLPQQTEDTCGVSVPSGTRYVERGGSTTLSRTWQGSPAWTLGHTRYDVPAYTAWLIRPTFAYHRSGAYKRRRWKTARVQNRSHQSGFGESSRVRPQRPEMLLSMAHAGYSPEQIAEQLRLTLMRNEQRRWPDWRTQSPDQAVEHVR